MELEPLGVAEKLSILDRKNLWWNAFIKCVDRFQVATVYKHSQVIERNSASFGACFEGLEKAGAEGGLLASS